MHSSSTVRGFLSACALSTVMVASGCGDESNGPRPAVSTADVYGLASQCFSIDAAPAGKSSGRLLVPNTDGSHFEFLGKSMESASRLTLRAADLGIYLLRDADGAYVVGAEDGSLVRTETLDSDISLNQNDFVSPAEWEVLPIEGEARMNLRQLSSGLYLGTTGLEADVANAAAVAFYDAEGCAEFPELTVDATGTVTRTTFDDGDLFGVVDAHSHMFTNQSFGGGGVSHGAPYHQLGVEHALSDCTAVHGEEGRRDVIGYFFGGAEFTIANAAGALYNGKINEFNHHTDGYPTFTDWPSTWGTATHQTQYYKWVERAYLGGLRLIVNHATSNQVLCELTQGIKSQTPRMGCNEMVSAKRNISEARALERYVDAQNGGPGKGWFRVVESPAEAREVIAAGKLAVILGIETSNLFDCFLNPREGDTRCTVDDVKERLDEIHELGVRALFPVHKFDNGFSAGDGHRGFIELGNFVSSGQPSNFTEVDCPDVPSPFDHGGLVFGGLNEPRAVYDAAPKFDMMNFPTKPFPTLVPYIDMLGQPPLDGDFCQAAGMTSLGETLMLEMMNRGMIIEVDHFPRRSYQRAYELLVENDYPAAGTHGSSNRGLLYDLGGISTTGLSRCVNPDSPDSPAQGYRNRIQEIADHGAYPAEGFGFDLNGFAGGPRPRFGEDSGCSQPQDPATQVEYPFTSYAGDITLTAPQLGDREVDYNNEGMLHLGLLPEYIEDARNIGYTDEDLEPLFRSAEGYIRMWELAEARAAALRAEGGATIPAPPTP